jgi:predicted ATPase/class 3 adenylate cyclase/Tfp pilus assembly protein PilF
MDTLEATPRALLLTDVVDSTRIGVELGDAASAQLWTAHDRVARDLLDEWHGREIDKSDGMLLLFDSAAQAVAYAMAYHAALAALRPPLQARAGLHVGPVILRATPHADVARGAKPLEVDGAAKSIAARVMAVARGGQTLLSSSARTALPVDREMQVRSHGHWQLKGIAEPIELFEAAQRDALVTAPDDSDKAYRVIQREGLWLPLSKMRHSLPAERDSFIGRTDPLRQLTQQFDAGARLVSVLGIGGLGKTRLVTRFGWRSLGDFAGGIWFCDLAQAHSLDGIVHAVAEGLEMPLGRGDPVVQIGHAIAARGPTLLILDNFEQVTALAQASVGEWLACAARARFLVTTREVLGISGEVQLTLDPLAPLDAAELFIARAQAIRPGWQPQEQELDALWPLLGLLDGLPLAIELAAARLHVMPARVLLERMRDRFRLLTSSGSGRIDRQATLRAVFDWSWDLLNETEKAALAQLSVFDGGFTLDAVEHVLDLTHIDADPWPVDVLQSLVQKSLVRHPADDRFELLVSVQEYAAEHLRTPGRYAGSGDDARMSAEQRHGAWFAEFSDTVAQAHDCVELENLVMACRRAVRRGDGKQAVRLLHPAWAALKLRGPFQVAVDLGNEVRAIAGLDDRSVASVELLVGEALEACGRSAEAYAHFEASHAMAVATGDRVAIARAQCSLGELDTYTGRADAARRRLNAAGATAFESGDRRLACAVHNALGNMEQLLGRIDAAQTEFDAALTLARAVGDRHREAAILGNLGNLCIDRGELDPAITYHRAALEAARSVGNRRLEGNTLCNLGMVQLMGGQLHAAQADLTLALAAARDLGQAHLEGVVLCNLGIVSGRCDRPDAAREYFELALAAARAAGDRYAEGQTLGYLGVLHARADRPRDALQCLDAGEALLRATADMSSLGVLLCGRAEALHLAGDRTAAAAALSEAATIARNIGAGPDSELGQALEPARKMLDAAAG